jgi:hypothetical protein
MSTIEIDARTALDDLARFIDAFPKEGGAAARRAINKTLGWVNSKGLRAIAAEHGIPLKTLRGRRRVSMRRATGQSLSGRIWFGLAPIKAVYLGTPRQTKSGVRVGGLTFPGAFIATMPSGHLGVFKRADSLSRRSVGRSAGSQPNLPIVEQTVTLSAARESIRAIFAQVPERFRTVFMQELRFGLFIQKGLR